jgi:hypothetical protein
LGLDILSTLSGPNILLSTILGPDILSTLLVQIFSTSCWAQLFSSAP